MTEIMTIEDAFILPGKGVVISGVNSLLDSESAEWIKALIGSRVRVAHAGGHDATFKVKDVGISESLLGSKNVSILVDSVGLDLLARGGRVLTT